MLVVPIYPLQTGWITRGFTLCCAFFLGVARIHTSSANEPGEHMAGYQSKFLVPVPIPIPWFRDWFLNNTFFYTNFNKNKITSHITVRPFIFQLSFFFHPKHKKKQTINNFHCKRRANMRQVSVTCLLLYMLMTL